MKSLSQSSLNRKSRIESLIPAEPGWRAVLVSLDLEAATYALTVRRVIGWAVIAHPTDRQEIEGVVGEAIISEQIDRLTCVDELDDIDETENNFLGYLEPGHEFHAEQWASVAADRLQSAIKRRGQL